MSHDLYSLAAVLLPLTRTLNHVEQGNGYRWPHLALGRLVVYFYRSLQLIINYLMQQLAMTLFFVFDHVSWSLQLIWCDSLLAMALSYDHVYWSLLLNLQHLMQWLAMTISLAHVFSSACCLELAKAIFTTFFHGFATSQRVFSDEMTDQLGTEGWMETNLS